MARKKKSRAGRVSRKPAGTARRKVVSLKEALLTRDEWLRLAAQGSELGLWYWNEVTQSLYCDRKTREIFGVKLEGDVTLDTFFDAMHPDDVARVKKVWRYELLSGLPYELEYRVRRPDGNIRWVSARGKGHYDKAGAPLHMVGVVLDITERKELESDRLELSGRLINAQEKERKHLAMEIHDDFCQRFAVLTLRLQSLADTIKDPQAASLLKELVGTSSDLGSDLQKFSHRLHSIRLDVLGLVSGVESLCTECSRDYGIQIAFINAGFPRQLAPELALCLFRVVQEALHNIVKHSDASRAEVSMRADYDEVALTIFDNGKGLDLGTSRISGGIGIQSMQERVRMCAGKFEIHSRPYVDGTQIKLTLPYPRSTAQS